MHFGCTICTWPTQTLWEHGMDSSVDHATAPGFGEPAAGRLPDDHVEALAAIALRDPVTTGVGAVMALHAVDQQTATTALHQAADQFQVPVSDVAQTLLTLVAGTDEQFGAMAGGAALQLLVQGFTGRERDADARDRAADRRDDIAAKREARLDLREEAVQAVLAAAEERDRLAEARDRRAEGRDTAAESRSLTAR